jgi:6-pyruvoyl-tetrahydropterin synthase
VVVFRELQFRAIHSHHGMMSEPPHSHDFRLVGGIEGGLNEEGFVCDFRAVKRLVQRVVIRELEGKELDSMFEYATSENLALWAWDRLSPYYNLHSIEIWEKPHSRVAYYGPSKGDSR